MLDFRIDVYKRRLWEGLNLFIAQETFGFAAYGTHKIGLKSHFSLVLKSWNPHSGFLCSKLILIVICQILINASNFFELNYEMYMANINFPSKWVSIFELTSVYGYVKIYLSILIDYSF